MLSTYENIFMRKIKLIVALVWSGHCIINLCLLSLPTGKILYVDIQTDRNNQSKGMACIQFSTTMEALNAICKWVVYTGMASKRILCFKNVPRFCSSHPSSLPRSDPLQPCHASQNGKQGPVHTGF